MSFISSAGDVSPLLQILEKINPAQVTAVELMNTVHANQQVTADEVQTLKNQMVEAGIDIHELSEAAAGNAAQHLNNIIEKVEKIA